MLLALQSKMRNKNSIIFFVEQYTPKIIPDVCLHDRVDPNFHYISTRHLIKTHSSVNSFIVAQKG